MSVQWTTVIMTDFCGATTVARSVAFFLQFSDSHHSSPQQISALFGQYWRSADIGPNGAPASLATAMAASWTQSRVFTSMPAGRRCATERGSREASPVVPAAADGDDVRRNTDGSIDVEFYKTRARANRQAAMARFARAMRRRMRTAWARAYDIILARR